MVAFYEKDVININDETFATDCYELDFITNFYYAYGDINSTTYGYDWIGT